MDNILLCLRMISILTQRIILHDFNCSFSTTLSVFHIFSHLIISVPISSPKWLFISLKIVVRFYLLQLFQSFKEISVWPTVRIIAAKERLLEQRSPTKRKKRRSRSRWNSSLTNCFFSLSGGRLLLVKAKHSVEVRRISICCRISVPEIVGCVSASTSTLDGKASAVWWVFQQRRRVKCNKDSKKRPWGLKDDVLSSFLAKG